VPTDTIDAIYRTLGIAQDELPMLKRRHSLALKIDDKGKNPFDGTGKLPKGMVTQGAGRITFATDEQAAGAGKADARAIKSALDHSRSPVEVRSILQKLKANSGDSVYADALIGILGPKGVAQISDWAQGAELNHQGKDAKLAYSGVGGALALASHNIADPSKWLDGLERPLNSTLDSRGYPTKAVAPFLAYGDFDPSFLEQVGKRELGSATTVPDPERSRQIWAALAKSPRAASLLFQLDMPSVADYTNEKRPLAAGESKTIGEFSKVARAATIGVRKFDSHEADASVEALMNYYNTHPNYHTYDQMRNGYADLAIELWNDILYSISTPAGKLTKGGDPTRVGVELPPTAWKGFLTDVMRHTPAAAELLNKERSWANSEDQNIYEKIMHTQDGAKPDIWERAVIARMNALFTASGAEALAQLKQKDDKRADDWLKKVTLAFAEVKKNNVDIGGYFKDGVNALKIREGAKLQSKLQEHAKALMKQYFGDPDVKGVSGVLHDADYRERWEQHASNAWEAAQRANKGNLPEVDYGGHTWTGDPSHYEKKYNTKFTYVGSDNKVHILSGDQLGKGSKDHGYLDGWQQLRAYNEWLKDPAVARMIAKGSAGDVSEYSNDN